MELMNLESYLESLLKVEEFIKTPEWQTVSVKRTPDESNPERMQPMDYYVSQHRRYAIKRAFEEFPSWIEHQKATTAGRIEELRNEEA